MKLKPYIFLFAFFGVLSILPSQVNAAERVWSGGATGNLASVAANWQGGALPVSGDDVVLPAGATVNWDLVTAIPNNFTSNANLSLRSPLTLSGELKLEGGTLNSFSNPISVGSIKFSGGQANFEGSSLTVGGNWIFTGGAADLSAATVNFTGSGNKTITSGGKHFGAVNVNASGATIALSDDYFGDGALTVSNGTLSDGGKNMTLLGGAEIAGGILATSGTLTLSGTLGKPFLVSSGTFLPQDGSKVIYSPATSGSVSVAAQNYKNLLLNSRSVFSLSGPTLVAEQLTIGTEATLSLAGFHLSISGNGLINNGNILGSGGIDLSVGELTVLDGDLKEITALKNASGTIRARVEDKTENRKGDTAESLSGFTFTTVSGDRETTAAMETGAATGIFMTSSMVVHEGQAIVSNGQLEVGQNDIIFVGYVDPADAARTKSVQVAVSAAGASAAGTPQVVFGPALSNWASTGSSAGVVYSAHVVWTTDIPSSSSVVVSGGNLLVPITAGSLSPVTGHEVVISGLARGVTYSYKISSMSADGKTMTSGQQSFTVLADGDRVKTAGSSAVYWYLGGERNVFPNFLTYDSWFSNWSGIVTVPDAQMASIPLGTNVPVRAGTYLVKIQSDPRVYAVEPLGKLRWIQTEAQAVGLYGADWAKRVIDMDVAFFSAYSYGDPLPEGKPPEGYFYSSGGQNSVFLENSLHRLDTSAVGLNGLDYRFMSAPPPAILTGIKDGATYFGYAAPLNAVFFLKTSGAATAPAR